MDFIRPSAQQLLNRVVCKNNSSMQLYRNKKLVHSNFMFK